MPEGWAKDIEDGICPVCGKKNNRSYRCCSKECTAKFWVHKEVFWSADLKGMCFKRDDFTCQDCGANNKAHEEQHQRFEDWLGKFKKEDQKPYGYQPDGQFIQAIVAYERETNDLTPEFVSFECDHIVPIALGGDEYDLKNLQTLCVKDHKKKTAREAKDFARARKNQLTLTESLKDGKQSFIRGNL